VWGDQDLARARETAIQELGNCAVPVQPELADFLDRDLGRA
jgi:hypothetical protein